MNWVIYLFVSFLCGSIPFSVWLGKLLLRVDIRQYGDGNPGAANAFRAGSVVVGLLTLILDITKAAAPVGLAYNNLGFRGVPMLLIATAPILGHIFSPFLRFKGGKALATVLGVWIGLTIWKVPLAAICAVLIGIALTPISGWAVMLGLAGILTALLIWLPEPLLLLVWACQTPILIWTHREDLRQRLRFRPWLSSFFSKSRK